MEPGIADAAVARLQVLARPVGAHARHDGALVDVCAAVVTPGARRAERRVLLAVHGGALLAGHTPAESQTWEI